MDTPQTRWLSQAFLKRGYHILVLPNPWGSDYISYGPKKPTGHLLAEGKSLHSFLVKWKDKLPAQTKKLIKKTSVLGISYGAFASTMIGAWDSELKTPAIDGTITAISPPIRMRRTMLNLDDSIISIANDIRRSKFSFLWTFRRFCKTNRQADIAPKDYHTLKVITVKYGFHESLINNIVNLSDTLTLDWYPQDNGEFNEWQYSTIFQSYFEDYAPGVGRITRSQYGNILYWINRARFNGRNNIRVLWWTFWL
jgi:hypothetical protein